MALIEINNLTYDYTVRNEEGNIEETKRALDGVTLSIDAGEFVVVLGRNGGGKSTLAKHLNGILLPTEGTVVIGGRDTTDENEILHIRKRVGMVFQNPDNQIIANIVEEDVAFGPENLGIPTEEIWKRVAAALEDVGMSAYRLSSPNALSGGQKQRVAIAGVLAMHPKCIVLDESTAMLDPVGRKEVLATVARLNKEENITIVLITHYMEEAAYASRVVILDKGKVITDGTPREVFSDADAIKAAGLSLPQTTELADELIKAGVSISKGIISQDELVGELLKVFKNSKHD